MLLQLGCDDLSSEATVNHEVVGALAIDGQLYHHIVTADTAAGKFDTARTLDRQRGLLVSSCMVGDMAMMHMR